MTMEGLINKNDMLSGEADERFDSVARSVDPALT